MSTRQVLLAAEVRGVEPVIDRMSDDDTETLLTLMVDARTSLDSDIDQAVDRALEMVPALLRRPIRKVIGR